MVFLPVFQCIQIWSEYDASIYQGRTIVMWMAIKEKGDKEKENKNGR
jgi:hypothetical protein